MMHESQIANPHTVDDGSSVTTATVTNTDMSRDVREGDATHPPVQVDGPTPVHLEEESRTISNDEYVKQRQQPDESNQFQAEIREAIIELRRDFNAKLMYDEGKQRQLDVLHAELETYRRGFHFQLLRPIFTDLISLYNDMDKIQIRIASQDLSASVAQEFAHFREQVEEILRRNGVERFTTAGEDFDARRQRVITFVETDDPTQDKRIAEHIRPGFEYEGRIVTQPELVSAYRYVAVPTQESD